MTTTINTSTTNSNDVAFLKVATSAPDFENLPIEGVPDSYSGPTFVKKDYVYNTVTALPGQVTYFVVTPTAAVAYYSTAYDLDENGNVPPVPPDGQNMAGFVFPDAATIFGGAGVDTTGRANNCTNAVRARLLGQGAEMVCLNNSLLQYGSLATFKTPIERVYTPSFDSGGLRIAQPRLNGVSAIFKSVITSEASVTAVREGSYAVTMNREADFEFADVLDDVALDSVFQGYGPDEVVPIGEGQNVDFKGPAVVWDNGFDTIVFRVVVPPAGPGLSSVPQDFILKVFKTWEMQPAMNSLLHTLAHSSPALDQRTINMYHAMSKELPVSVPASQNPDFWNKILDGLHETSDVMKNVPILQPYAKGVHALTTLGRNIRGRVRQRRARRQKQQPKKSRLPRPPATRKVKGARRRK